MDINKSRDTYNRGGEEYERYYFDEDTGGFILIHRDHNTTDSEIFVAKILARSGKQVKLLTEKMGNRVKTPDAEINGELWEFKELKNAINIRGATQKDIRTAKKQAPNIGYHINQEHEINRINAGIESALRFDSEKLIQTITLIFNTENFETLTREELDNGKRFQ